MGRLSLPSYAPLETSRRGTSKPSAFVCRTFSVVQRKPALKIARSPGRSQEILRFVLSHESVMTKPDKASKGLFRIIQRMQRAMRKKSKAFPEGCKTIKSEKRVMKI